MLDTKAKFKNLPAEPSKIVEILIMDAQCLQKYYATMLAKSVNGNKAKSIIASEWARKFNQCNEIIGQLAKLR